MTTLEPQDAPSVLTRALIGVQNPDGGWGMYPGRPSATEATALATLALSGSVPQGDTVSRGRAWLLAHQAADGGWPASEQVPGSSWPTAPAVLALSKLSGEARRVESGLKWLLAREGAHGTWRERVKSWLFASEDERKINDLDNTIAGWPWMTGNFSWVEPTSMAVLALRAGARAVPSLRGAISERLDDGERLLVDRAVPSGGWNYGNRRVFEADLEAYPDTTAWALLAMRGSSRGAVVVAAALDRLAEQMRTNRSALARALAVLALQAHGRDARPLAAALLAQCSAASGDPAPSDARARALALLALTAPNALLSV
jgi:hypothetical protein